MIHLLAVSVPMEVLCQLLHSTANQTHTAPLGNHPPQLSHGAIVFRLNRHLLQMGFPISLTCPNVTLSHARLGIPSYETPWSRDPYDAAHPFSFLPSARSLPQSTLKGMEGSPDKLGTPAATQ